MIGGGTGVYRLDRRAGHLHGRQSRRSRTRSGSMCSRRCASCRELLRRVRRAGAGGAAQRDATRTKRGEAMNAADDGRMDIDEIMRYLPHRYPFLLVDRVTSIEPGKSIRGHQERDDERAAISGPLSRTIAVMPGVLVIEALAQLASILAWKMSGRTPGDGTLIFFAGIDDARFRRQVRPGDQLCSSRRCSAWCAASASSTCGAKVDGEIVAEANLLAAMRMPDIDAKGG